MNRSNSKIRHIQEANLKLEQSFVDSYFERDKAPDWVTNRFKETKPKVKTKPKTKSEIINFQNWVINTKKDNQILGKSGADGIWGQRSELAWNRYGVDYVPSKNKSSKNKGGYFKTFDDVRKFQNWVINVKKDRKLIGSADGDWGPKTKLAWNKYGSEYVKSGGSKTITGEKTLVNKDTNRKFVNILNDKKLNPSDSVAIFPAGQEKCAQFVNDFADGIPEGSIGPAWIAHDNSSLGPLIHSSFHNLKPEDIKTAINYWSQLNKKGGGVEGGGLNSDIATFVKKLVPKSASVSLKLGDVVGLVYPTSKHYEEAFYEAGKIYFKKGSDGKTKPGKNISAGTGWGMNTHLGIVGAIKDGTPIIFHNIGGQVWADPANNMHGGCKVAWVRRRGSNPIAFNQLKSTDSGLTEEKKNDLNEIIDDESFKDESIIKPKNKYPCLNKELSLAVDYTISNNVNKFFIKYAIGILKRESDFGHSKRYMGQAPFEYVINKLSDLIPGFGSMIKWGAKKIFGKPNWVPSMGIAQMTPDIAKKYGISLERLMNYSGSLMGASKYLTDLYSQAKQRYSTNSPTNIIQDGKVVVNPNSTGNAALDIAIMSYNMGYGKFDKKYCKTNSPKFMAPCDSPNGKYLPFEKKYPKFVLTVDKTKVIKDYAPKLSFGKLTNLGYLKEVNDYTKKINCIK